jgi:small subunit ribosomal protein S20
MPVTKSAEKQRRKSIKARERNRAVKADFRNKVKEVSKGIKGNHKDLEKKAAEAVSAIDKAAKTGVIHKGAADRRKSRLMLALNKALGKPVELKAIREKSEKPKTAAKKPAAKKTATPKASTTAKKSTTKKAAK